MDIPIVRISKWLVLSIALMIPAVAPAAPAAHQNYVRMNVEGNTLELSWTSHDKANLTGPRRLAYWTPNTGKSPVQIVEENGKKYVRMNVECNTLELSWTSHDKANLTGPRRLAYWTPNTGKSPVQIVEENGKKYIQMNVEGNTLELNWTSHDKANLTKERRLAYWTPNTGQAEKLTLNVVPKPGESKDYYSPPFYIKQYTSDWTLHPEGGGQPHNDQRPVLYPGKAEHGQFVFRPSSAKSQWGHIISSSNCKKILIPSGGAVDSEEGAEIVFHQDSGKGAWFSIDPITNSIRHFGGLYVHPKGGKTNPSKNTAVLLWNAPASKERASRFVPVNASTDKVMTFQELYNKPTVSLFGVTYEQGTGRWEPFCPGGGQSCDIVLTENVTTGGSESKTDKTETAASLSVALSYGVKVGGDAYGGSVESNTTVTGSTSLATSSAKTATENWSRGSSKTEKIDISYKDYNVFMVWTWQVHLPASDGTEAKIQTGSYTCTPDAEYPKYLPGSPVHVANPCLILRKKPPTGVAQYMANTIAKIHVAPPGFNQYDGISLDACLDIARKQGFHFANYTKDRLPANSRCNLFKQTTVRKIGGVEANADWDLYEMK